MKKKKPTYSSFLHSPFLFYPITAVTAILPFLNVLDGEFVFDDGPALVTNPDVLGSSSLGQLLQHDFWGNDIRLPGSHKSYRPLTVLSFRLTRSLFGLSSLPLHLGNVFLHSAVSCLVFWLAEQLRLKKSCCLLSALLFAVHPVHCEAVSSIVGRADVLSTFFVLLGILLWDKYESPFLTIVLTVAALLTKETGLVLPILVFSFDLLVRRQMIRLHSTHISQGTRLLASVVLLTFLRIFFSGQPSFSSADNPLPHEKSSFTRWATLFYLPVRNLQFLLFPKDLCFDWSMGAVPLVSSIDDSRLWTAFGTYLVSLAVLFSFCQQKCYQQLFCIIFGAVSFLPASNLFIYVGFLVAERVLYLPSAGFCILAAVFLQELCKKLNWSFPTFALAILIILSARTLRRNEDWRTAENLYKSALNINPAKAYSNLGQVLASQGQTEAAAKAYKEALQFRSMADTWYNLGVLQSGQGNHSAAIRSYSKAIELRSSFAAAHLNLGISLLKQKREAEAVEIFGKCTRLDGKDLKNWKMHWEAQKACHLQKGNIFKRRGRNKEAKENFLAALEEKDLLYPTIMTSLAEVEARLNHNDTAKLRLEQVLGNYPNHTAAILLYARNLLENNGMEASERFLRRSLKNSPECADCMNELALLLADKDPEEAEDLLRKASLLSSKTTHLLNYAVILQRRRKLEQAQLLYKEIIKKEPENSLALENYQKLQKSMCKKSI